MNVAVLSDFLPRPTVSLGTDSHAAQYSSSSLPSVATSLPSFNCLLGSTSIPTRRDAVHITNNCGEIVAGSLGIRALITNLIAADTTHAEVLVDQVLKHLHREGSRRVHALVEPESLVTEVLQKNGFHSCKGESLFTMKLDLQKIVDESRIKSGFILRDGTVDDLIRVGLKLKSMPELAFAAWEIPSLGSQLGRPNRYFHVIEHDQALVAVSIGGSFGEKGTISHHWVSSEFRGFGLGRALVDASLKSLAVAGAQEIHLMTTAGNESANNFWIKSGFSFRSKETFLEIDL